MANNYVSFVEELREAIIQKTGLPGERIYFEKKGGAHAQNGDRLFIECAISEKTKEICGIFTQELYSKYQYTNDVLDFAEEVAQEIARVRSTGFFDCADKLDSFTAAKDFLTIRMLNIDRCRVELKDAIYRTVGDLALVLYIQLGEGEGCVTSAKVKKKHAEVWDIGEETLFEFGLHNMKNISPPRVYLWEKLMIDFEYCGEDILDDVYIPADEELEQMRSPMGICLSTKNRTNGASAIFVPGVAEKIGEMLGEDFYLVFTSVHEVMLHAKSAVDLHELKQILRDTVDETTPEQDFLTYHIYEYDRDNGIYSFVL